MDYNKKFRRIKYGKYNKSREVGDYVLFIGRQNIETGEVEEYREFKEKKIQSKKGWNKMYKNDFRAISLELLNNKMAHRVWLYLWDYFKKDGTIRMPLQKDIAKDLNTRPEAISKSLRFLKQIEAIEKIDNEWRYNPYLFGLSGQSEAELYEAQRIWEEWIGYYEFKNGKNQSKYID